MEAKIITLPKLKIVGMQTFGNAKDGQMPQMWDLLICDDLKIPNRVNENLSYGVEIYTKEMQTIGKWFYMAAVEVASFDDVPVQLSAKIIPQNTYASFEYSGAISPKLAELFQEIYKEWLPKSGYVQAGPFDLEKYDERFLGPSNDESIMEILIPIRKV